MLVDSTSPSARSAVHLVMIREKVRPSYPEVVPECAPPVATTSYRLKDRVHIQDLDAAGLITPAIEADLSEELSRRLAETRATA
ncbi:MAG TPA: hypothetical protein VG456_24735 [Candidatus Sulfopaludibacter sp.]|jgi:hypothetical protein|nr:hypothetical protein [Candidatus Sulfopaludibacter sp.]